MTPSSVLSLLNLSLLAFYLQAVLCGGTVPPPVLSYDSIMVLHFTSDSSVTGRGFHATPTFIQRSGLNIQYRSCRNKQTNPMQHPSSSKTFRLYGTGPFVSVYPLYNVNAWTIIHIDFQATACPSRWCLFTYYRPLSLLTELQDGQDKRQMDEADGTATHTQFRQAQTGLSGGSSFGITVFVMVTSYFTPTYCYSDMFALDMKLPQSQREPVQHCWRITMKHQLESRGAKKALGCVRKVLCSFSVSNPWDLHPNCLVLLLTKGTATSTTMLYTTRWRWFHCGFL